MACSCWLPQCLVCRSSFASGSSAAPGDLRGGCSCFMPGCPACDSGRQSLINSCGAAGLPICQQDSDVCCCMLPGCASCFKAATSSPTRRPAASVDEFDADSEPEDCSESGSDSSGGDDQECLGAGVSQPDSPAKRRLRCSVAETDQDLSPGPGALTIASWALDKCEKLGLLDPIMRAFRAGPVTVGSMCSGMDVAKVVWDAISVAVSKRCGPRRR